MSVDVVPLRLNCSRPTNSKGIIEIKYHLRNNQLWPHLSRLRLYERLGLPKKDCRMSSPNAPIWFSIHSVNTRAGGS